MSQETLGLGKIIIGPQERDAIHIAVIPVVAGEGLNPGARIVMKGDFAFRAEHEGEYIGIADPFIGDGYYYQIEAKQHFWLWLIPGSITSLRHVWTHPAFPLPEDGPVITKTASEHQADSEKWLRREAERLDIGYRALLEAARTWIEEAEYTVQSGHSSWRDDFGDPKEFWHHFEIVTGTKVKDHEATFFCCTC